MQWANSISSSSIFGFGWNETYCRPITRILCERGGKCTWTSKRNRISWTTPLNKGLDDWIQVSQQIKHDKRLRTETSSQWVYSFLIFGIRKQFLSHNTAKNTIKKEGHRSQIIEFFRSSQYSTGFSIIYSVIGLVQRQFCNFWK